MKIKEKMWDEVRPKNVAGIIHILVSSKNEEDYVNPQWEKCESAADYCISIQGRKWQLPLFVNGFETALHASFILNLVKHDSLNLLDFRRNITLAYLGF